MNLMFTTQLLTETLQPKSKLRQLQSTVALPSNCVDQLTAG